MRIACIIIFASLVVSVNGCCAKPGNIPAGEGKRKRHLLYPGGSSETHLANQEPMNMLKKHREDKEARKKEHVLN